jgi:hypothetical protein
VVRKRIQPRTRRSKIAPDRRMPVIVVELGSCKPSESENGSRELHVVVDYAIFDDLYGVAGARRSV